MNDSTASDSRARPHIFQRVDSYIRYRPGYPNAVLDLLQSECRLGARHAIADVGSGTGKLAELFLGNGNRVFGVEPDADMRAGAEYALREYDNFVSVAASAEDTTLPDASVDFVTAGQSFHWFDLPAARREFGRILRPSGWVVLVWNVQRHKGSPFQEALQAFWETERFWYFPSPAAARQMERVQAHRLNPDLVRRDYLDPFFGPGAYEERLFENPMKCDLAGLQGRVLSNAPALRPGDAHYGEMLGALEDMFRAHQAGGTVTIEHDCRVAYGQL